MKRSKIKTIHLLTSEKAFIGICVASMPLFNFIFLEWTSEHEFSLIPYSIIFSFLIGLLIISTATTIKWGFLTVLILFSTTQYYLINRPGKVSQNGTPYKVYMDIGETVKKAAPTPYSIFTNLKVLPMMEYYAGRNMTFLPDKAAAEKYTRDFNIPKSMWIEGKNDTIINIQVIKD